MVEELRGMAATSYVYKPNTFVPLAQIVGPQGEADEVELAVRYYHTDQIGTPQELTTSTGQIAWLGHYAAWGNVLKVESAVEEEIEQPIRFQGQYFDNETGLHYNRHRYYDPDIGSFVTHDPIGLLGGTNLYGYTANPTGWIDPLGLNASQEDCCGSLKGNLGGTRTKIDKKADAATARSIMRENEAADVMVENGFDIVQNPRIDGTSRKPDQLIVRGKVGDVSFQDVITDVYSPAEKTSPRNIRGTIDEKVNKKKQADTIVLNMQDSLIGPDDIVAAIKSEPAPNLRDIIFIRDGKVIVLPIH